MKNTIKQLWTTHKTTVTALAAIAVIYLVLFALGITCPIKYITGVSCPGCGMSRACFAALRFDFAAAFAYHPLWIALPVALPTLFVLNGRHRRAFRAVLGVCVVVMLGVWLYRMLLCDTAVVVFAPADGMIGRAVQAVTAWWQSWL